MRFLTIVLFALVLCLFAAGTATACDPSLPQLSASFYSARVNSGFGLPLYSQSAYYDPNFALRQELLFRSRATSYYPGVDVRFVPPVTVFSNSRRVLIFP